MALAKEFDALKGGFRVRSVLLGLMLVGGLGAAMWSGTREVGIGEPERRHRVMVVTEQGGIDYYAVLERGGFELEVDRYETWLERAREIRGESEARGVALLLELADLDGVGYVVFESPGARDFSGLELEPARDGLEQLEQRDYAVLSVGDLAFPHVLSADEPGDDALVRLPGYGALEALFAQPSLLARVDEELPTVEELQHEARIELGLRMAQRPASFAEALARAHEEITASLAADPSAPSVVPPWETGSAIFDPEGGLLVIHHALDIYSEDAKRLELHPAELMRFDYLAPAALDAHITAGAAQPGQAWREPPLTPCTSLAGGSIEMQRGPRLEAAADGSALAISTRGGSTSIWHRERSQGCAWQAVAELDGRLSSSMVLAPALASGELQLLMAQTLEGQRGAGLRVWTGTGLATGPAAGGPAADDARADHRGSLEPQLLEPVELLRLAEAQLSSAIFVSGQQLALLSSTPLPAIEQTTTHRKDHVIHVVDRRAPGAHLRIPAEFFAPRSSLLELALAAPPEPPSGAGAAAAPAQGPAFVLTTTQGLAQSEIVWLQVSASAWDEFTRAAPAEFDALGPLAPGASPRLYALEPGDLELRRLPAVEEQARLGLSVGAGVLAYVSADGAAASELSWLELGASPWEVQRLTQNTVVDTLPRVSADGTKLVFMSMVRSEISAVPYSIPRVLEL